MAQLSVRGMKSCHFDEMCKSIQGLKAWSTYRWEGEERDKHGAHG